MGINLLKINGRGFFGIRFYYWGISIYLAEELIK